MKRKLTSGAKISREMTKISYENTIFNGIKQRRAEERNPQYPGEEILNKFYDEVTGLFEGKKTLMECSSYTKRDNNATLIAALIATLKQNDSSTNDSSTNCLSSILEALWSIPRKLTDIVPTIKIIPALSHQTRKSILKNISEAFMDDDARIDRQKKAAFTKVDFSYLVRRAEISEKLGKEANKKAFANTDHEPERE